MTPAETILSEETKNDGGTGGGSDNGFKSKFVPLKPVLEPSTGNGGAQERLDLNCDLEESVTSATLSAHLQLLRMMQSLVIIDDEDRDFLFLIQSEKRYLMYLDLLQKLQPPLNMVPLPPLGELKEWNCFSSTTKDVALMWTVHLLAPYRYREDLLKSYSPHLLSYAFPIERYVSSVDLGNPSTNHEAFLSSKETWRQRYPEEAFDLDKDDTSRMFEIQCTCGTTIAMDSPTYIKFRIDSTSVDCEGCGSQCSLKILSSKRVWDDIQLYLEDSSVLLGEILDTIKVQGHIRPSILACIMESYIGLVENRLSIDLVAGALRQRCFQKAVVVPDGLAWCQPQVLQRSLDRYKKFMFLAREESRPTVGNGDVAGVDKGSPVRIPLVPTLDIDLVWHTHMLSPGHYRQYQLVHFGRVLNHDDSVKATSIRNQDFERTRELYQEKYQEKYTNQKTYQEGDAVGIQR
ncbi:hypothetical protein BGZ83_012206 [Gryganskiella cystojenkinii]|nr:hypothetical protein BGZ83_012206 [Gryganskiella cystojenkinii]